MRSRIFRRRAEFRRNSRRASPVKKILMDARHPSRRAFARCARKGFWLEQRRVVGCQPSVTHASSMRSSIFMPGEFQKIRNQKCTSSVNERSLALVLRHAFGKTPRGPRCTARGRPGNVWQPRTALTRSHLTVNWV